MPFRSTPVCQLPPGVGVGLKPQHYAALLLDLEAGRHPVTWVEVHPQNYFGEGGPPHRWLSAISAFLPVSFHSVGLSLGSAQGLITDELTRLAALCHRYDPAAVSDHLSWSGHDADRLPDLIAIPYTTQSLHHFAAQVTRMQDMLCRPVLIENPARMLSWADDTMDEPEFIGRLIESTGCGLLLDINNVVVSAGNLGFDAASYVDAIDPAWVGEMHLAGHLVEQHDSGPLYIDNHGSPVGGDTWDLFARFVRRAGPRPVLIEWDTDVPDYDVLMTEAAKASAIMASTCGEVSCHVYTR